MSTGIVIGNVAAGATDAGAPVKTGGVAVNALPAALNNGQRSNFITTLDEKQIIQPYANPENAVFGNVSSTDTADHLLLGAPGSGLKNYVVNVNMSNTGASTTLITFKDGNGGSVLWYGIAPAGGGSNPPPFEVPWHGSANTAIYFACGTASSTVYVSAAGYKGV
jgi:hypothetical protein